MKSPWICVNRRKTTCFPKGGMFAWKMTSRQVLYKTPPTRSPSWPLKKSRNKSTQATSIPLSKPPRPPGKFFLGNVIHPSTLWSRPALCLSSSSSWALTLPTPRTTGKCSLRPHGLWPTLPPEPLCKPAAWSNMEPPFNSSNSYLLRLEFSQISIVFKLFHQFHFS